LALAKTGKGVLCKLYRSPCNRSQGGVGSVDVKFGRRPEGASRIRQGEIAAAMDPREGVTCFYTPEGGEKGGWTFSFPSLISVKRFEIDLLTQKKERRSISPPHFHLTVGRKERGERKNFLFSHSHVRPTPLVIPAAIQGGSKSQPLPSRYKRKSNQTFILLL